MKKTHKLGYSFVVVLSGGNLERMRKVTCERHSEARGLAHRHLLKNVTGETIQNNAEAVIITLFTPHTMTYDSGAFTGQKGSDLRMNIGETIVKGIHKVSLSDAQTEARQAVDNAKRDTTAYKFNPGSSGVGKFGPTDKPTKNRPWMRG